MTITITIGLCSDVYEPTPLSFRTMKDVAKFYSLKQFNDFHHKVT